MPGDDPKVILSRSFPMVRVEYEYDKFLIDADLHIIDGSPLAVKAGIFLVDSIEKPVLTRIFQVGEKIEFMLPRNLLLDSPAQTVLRLEVTGDDYESYESSLNVPVEGDLNLETISIKLREMIIEGQIVTRSDNQPLISAQIGLDDSLSTIRETITDVEGKFNFVLPGAMVKHQWLDITVDTDGQYLPQKKRLSISGKKYHVARIPLGPTKELLSNGVEYRVNKNRVPLREGPENGSRIKYFLGRGESFVVSKTAGDRVYGYIETVNDEKNFRTQDDGWVLIQYLDLLQ